MLLWLLLSGCGGGGQTASELPPEPAVDQQAMLAIEQALASAHAPDAAIAEVQGQIARIYAEQATSAAAHEAVEAAFWAALRDGNDLLALADLSRSAAGGVFSTRFAQPLAALAQLDDLCPDNPAPEPDLVVYFINGVWNSIIQALNNVKHLDAVLTDNGITAEFRLFYNPSGGDTDEDLCNQLGLELTREGIHPSLETALQRAAERLCGSALIPDLGEAALQYARHFLDLSLNGGTDPLLVDRLESLIRQDVLSGKQVLLVAHSQGNFYAYEALRGLQGTFAGTQPVLDAVRALAVGSPSNYEEASSHVAFVQLVGDPVTAFAVGVPQDTHNESSDAFQLACADPAGFWDFVLSFPAFNVVTDAACLVEGFREVHPFASSYAGQPGSVRDIVTRTNTLVGDMLNSLPAAGQGYFQVTLTWDVAGDIDLHVEEPTGFEVYYGARSGHVGRLDRDDIAGTGPENYYVCSPGAMLPGDYFVTVNNFGGATGTTATITVRAGSKAGTYTRTMVAPNANSILQPVVRVSFLNGEFTLQEVE